MFPLGTKIIEHDKGVATKNVAVVQDGTVINVVKVPDYWTGAEGEWQAPDGCEGVEAPLAHIGDVYAKGKFLRKVVWNDDQGNPIPDFEIDVHDMPDEVIPPEPSPKVDRIKAIEDQLADIKAAIAK